MNAPNDYESLASMRAELAQARDENAQMRRMLEEAKGLIDTAAWWHPSDGDSQEWGRYSQTHQQMLAWLSRYEAGEPATQEPT